MARPCHLPVLAAVAVVGLLCAAVAADDATVVDARTHFLRSGDAREWDEFPEQAEGRELVVRFDAKAAAGERTLRLVQRDVKRPWGVRLNGTRLGTLVQDENRISAVLAVPAGALKEGANELRVTCEAGAAEAPDDVEIGRVELIPRPRAAVLSEATLKVRVDDADGAGPLPCRITVIDAGGALATTGATSGKTLAVRPGVIYSGDGTALCPLAAGEYTVYAGRGFEYSVASEKVSPKPGETADVKLTIRRVVPTDGSVSCDTHVHTLTYSRHGDATLDERILTLAGEGIVLPVSTEHNLQIDYGAAAGKGVAGRYFTPVVGNEVTTASLGHFNVFPVPSGAKLINWRGRDWGALSRSIDENAPGAVVVLNHARDVHGGFAPFGAGRHVSVAGEDLDGHAPPGNAMEVINSGATRSDAMDLVRDWFGVLNRGRKLTPIGASDSHDVARYVVGQGRTYVNGMNAADPSGVDVRGAVAAILAGRVDVSYGLLARMTIAERFRSGDLAPLPATPDPLDVEVRVIGPEWTTASRVALYANGVEVEHADIPHGPAGGPQPAPVKWQGRWSLPRPKHDVYLVAVATGPGVSAPYWPAAKPFQPTSSHFESYVLGVTGAVFVDADGNGRFDSAFDYASRLVADAAQGDVSQLSARLAARLADYDEATAVQAASLLRSRDPASVEAVCRAEAASAPAPVQRGMGTYLAQWRRATAAGEKRQ